MKNKFGGLWGVISCARYSMLYSSCRGFDLRCWREKQEITEVNRGTQHYSSADFVGERKMNRVRVVEDERVSRYM